MYTWRRYFPIGDALEKVDQPAKDIASLQTWQSTFPSTAKRFNNLRNFRAKFLRSISLEKELFVKYVHKNKYVVARCNFIKGGHSVGFSFYSTSSYRTAYVLVQRAVAVHVPKWKQ